MQQEELEQSFTLSSTNSDESSSSSSSESSESSSEDANKPVARTVLGWPINSPQSKLLSQHQAKTTLLGPIEEEKEGVEEVSGDEFEKIEQEFEKIRLKDLEETKYRERQQIQAAQVVVASVQQEDAPSSCFVVSSDSSSSSQRVSPTRSLEGLEEEQEARGDEVFNQRFQDHRTRDADQQRELQQTRMMSSAEITKPELPGCGAESDDELDQLHRLALGIDEKVEETKQEHHTSNVVYPIAENQNIRELIFKPLQRSLKFKQQIENLYGPAEDHFR